MRCIRTSVHEETELLTVLKFPFRVRTPYPFDLSHSLDGTLTDTVIALFRAVMVGSLTEDHLRRLLSDAWPNLPVSNSWTMLRPLWKSRNILDRRLSPPRAPKAVPPSSFS